MAEIARQIARIVSAQKNDMQYASINAHARRMAQAVNVAMPSLENSKNFGALLSTNWNVSIVVAGTGSGTDEMVMPERKLKRLSRPAMTKTAKT